MLPGGLVLPPLLLSHLQLLPIFLLRVITIISIGVSVIVASPSNGSLVPGRVYSKFVSVHLMIELFISTYWCCFLHYHLCSPSFLHLISSFLIVRCVFSLTFDRSLNRVILKPCELAIEIPRYLFIYVTNVY